MRNKVLITVLCLAAWLCCAPAAKADSVTNDFLDHESNFKQYEGTIKPGETITLSMKALGGYSDEDGIGSYTHTPPDPGTPFPAAHNGTFVCDRDTLWFNGDGKTVSWHFAQPLPELAAKGKGEYVFLFGHGKWRYDAAEKLRLIDTAHDNGSHTFLLAAPAADSLITLYVDKGAHVASAPFRKAIL